MPAKPKTFRPPPRPVADPLRTPVGTRLWHPLFGPSQVAGYLPDGGLQITLDSNGKTETGLDITLFHYAKNVKLYAEWADIRKGDYVRRHGMPLGKVREVYSDGTVELAAYNDPKGPAGKYRPSEATLRVLRRLSAAEAAFLRKQFREFRTRSRSPAWETKLSLSMFADEIGHFYKNPRQLRTLKDPYEHLGNSSFSPTWKNGHLLSVTSSKDQKELAFNVIFKDNGTAWGGHPISDPTNLILVWPTWHKPRGYWTTIRKVREGKSTLTAILELEVETESGNLPILALDEQYLCKRHNYAPNMVNIMGLTGYVLGVWAPPNWPHAALADIVVLEILATATNLGVTRRHCTVPCQLGRLESGTTRGATADPKS